MESADLPFDLDRLSTLTETSGAPGYEDRVRDLVRESLADSTDEVRTDAMGNVVGTLRGEREDYAVVVAAHMDEIGFMVRHVDDAGFLELEPLGGWDPRVLRAQRVRVHARGGDLPGVIGSKPPHLQDDGESEGRDVSEAFVDLGLPRSRVEDRVRVGDLVTMDAETRLVGHHVTGKAIDDRACLFAMLAVARRLTDPAVTVHFAATVQEEVGVRGATALGVDLDADLTLVLDTTAANDVPGIEGGETVTELGDGVAVKLKDGGVIATPKVADRLRDLADERAIHHQVEVLPAGYTDATGFQRTQGATPVGALSLPTRYLHTVTESAHVDDLAGLLDLTEAFLATETGDHDYAL